MVKKDLSWQKARVRMLRSKSNLCCVAKLVLCVDNIDFQNDSKLQVSFLIFSNRQLCLKSQLHVKLTSESFIIFHVWKAIRIAIRLIFKIRRISLSKVKRIRKSRRTSLLTCFPRVCNWCVCNVILKSIYIIYGNRVKWSGNFGGKYFKV